jgi:1,4-dihydroxy-2-naphthoate octaprenyltransferase
MAETNRIGNRGRGVRLKLWFMEMRAPFFTATVVPTVFGAAFAWYDTDSFDPILFLVTLLGVLFLHAGTNVVNDYFDYCSGTDKTNRNRSPFNGGSPFVVEGVLSPQEIYRAAIAFFAAGGVIGLVLAFTVTWVILPLGLLGAALGYFYTSPKVNLAAKGLGEVAVGMGFGPLVVGGAYIVQTGGFVWLPFIAGIPIGLLVGLILFVNQFPDMEPDADAGKTHWVVRMGLEKAAIWYVGLMAAAFGSIVALWVTGVYPALALIGLIPGLMALKAVRIVLRDHDEFKRLLPAQAMTVQVHLMVGALMTVGLLAAQVL